MAGISRPNPLAFVGGAVAGATATVCPFDVVRTVLAAQGSPRVYDSLAEAARGIVRDRGVRGLAGVGVTLVEIIPASAIRFGTYALFQAAALARRVRRGRAAERASAACGFASGCVRARHPPLGVVKKRFQVAGLARVEVRRTRHSRGFSTFGGAFRAIAAKEGVRGFYKGWRRGWWPARHPPSRASSSRCAQWQRETLEGGGNSAQHAGRGS